MRSRPSLSEVAGGPSVNEGTEGPSDFLDVVKTTFAKQVHGVRWDPNTKRSAVSRQRQVKQAARERQRHGTTR